MALLSGLDRSLHTHTAAMDRVVHAHTLFRLFVAPWFMRAHTVQAVHGVAVRLGSQLIHVAAMDRVSYNPSSPARHFSHLLQDASRGDCNVPGLR